MNKDSSQTVFKQLLLETDPNELESLYVIKNQVHAKGLTTPEDIKDYLCGVDKLETENTKLKKIAVLLAIWTLGELLFIIIQRFVIGTPIGG